MTGLNKVGLFLMLLAIYLRIITDVEVFQIIAIFTIMVGGILILAKEK